MTRQRKEKTKHFDSAKAALENYATALENLERCLWDNFGEAPLAMVAGISKGPDSDQFEWRVNDSFFSIGSQFAVISQSNCQEF